MQLDHLMLTLLMNIYIREGKIVPVEITCRLLKKAMEENGWDKAKFLIDGYVKKRDNGVFIGFRGVWIIWKAGKRLWERKWRLHMCCFWIRQKRL